MAEGQRIELQEGSLRTAAGVTRTARASFNREGTVLMGEIQGMAAGWVGEGGSAFQTLAQQWQERQQRISRLLDDLADQLERTEQDSLVGDSDVASEIRSQAHSFSGSALDG